MLVSNTTYYAHFPQHEDGAPRTERGGQFHDTLDAQRQCQRCAIIVDFSRYEHGSFRAAR